jgi:cytidylate kinase
VKLYVTASDAVRAERRRQETGGEAAAVLADLRARDARDAARDAAPMRPAPDAVLLDTTELTIDAAVERAVSLVDAALRGGPA